MMKTILAIATLALSLSILTAEEIKLPTFDKAKDGVPVGWTLNKGKWFAPLGSVKTEKQGEAGVVTLTSNGKATHIYTGSKGYPAKDGDKFEIQYDSKGTGNIGVGIYSYPEKGWLGSIYKLEAGTPEWTTKKVVIEVKDKADKKLAKVRFVVLVIANATGEFKNLKVKKLD